MSPKKRLELEVYLNEIKVNGFKNKTEKGISLNCSKFEGIRIVVIDLDGVIYHGKTVIPGAAEAIQKLRLRGLKAVFATNSSLKTRADVANKLTSMGIPATEQDVFTSAYLASLLIRRIGDSKKVLVIGMDGLKKEISYQAVVVAQPPCDFVVVGMDTTFSYEKIHMAMDAIMGGAVFIVCNRESNFPGDNGRIYPGCGPMVAAIEAAVGFSPKYMVGKPNVLMLENIAASYHAKSSEILVVGDSVESDVEMALAFGSPAVLVGKHLSRSKIGKLKPLYEIKSLDELPGLVLDTAPHEENVK
jgi:HAD superfamily hydrolase (TIGR01450 family)